MGFLSLPFACPSSRRPFLLCLLLGAGWLCACGDDPPLLGSANQAPTADAGVERVVEVAEAVVLDGRASRDADGDSLTYAWSLVDGPRWVGIDSAATPRARVRLPERGAYHFRLTVSDPDGASATDVVRLVAVPTGGTAPDNRPPFADAGPDRVVDAGTQVDLDGTASRDDDGDTLSFYWIQVAGPAVALTQAGSAQARVRPDAAGDYRFRLLVADARGGTGVDETVITVRGTAPPANEAPLATALAPPSAVVGQLVTLDGSASRDPEGALLSWSWVQVGGPETIPIGGALGQRATVTPGLAGRYTFRLTVTDPQGASGSAEVSVDVARAAGDVDIEGVFEAGGAG